MAVTGAPSTTGLHAVARRRRPRRRRRDTRSRSCRPSSGRAGRRALAGADEDADDPAARVEQRRAGDGRALDVDVEHLEQRGAVARVRVDLPLHGRDGGAEMRAVRGEHRAELLPGRVRVARAEALGPLEGRRDQQGQVGGAIAAPDLGVNDGSVRIANVGSVRPAQP